MDNLVTLKHICYSNPDDSTHSLILSDINLSIAAHEFVVLIGPSGCGKSVLLSLICGLLPPTSGSIETKCSHIGYMQQKERFFEWQTLYHNIMLGLQSESKDNHIQFAAHEAYIAHMMKACGLKEYRNHMPDDVPGSMKKKAALIRALALEPELLLMDDIFASLDYETRIPLVDEMHTLLKEEEKTVILTTHDISEAVCFGDTVVVLSAEGTIKQITSISFSSADYKKGDIRTSQKFRNYFNEIWRALNTVY